MISAQGDWVVLIYEHKISDSGIITNEGNSATVISGITGEACSVFPKENID